MKDPVRIIAIVDHFPSRSETFVARELLGLAARGVDIQVFALACGEGEAQDRLRTTYSRGPWADLWDAGRQRAGGLGAHLSTLLRVFRSDPRWLLFGLFRTGTVLQVANLARQSSRTCIQAHFLGAPAVLAACAAAAAAVPFSLSPHASLQAFSPRTVGRLLRRAGFTIACWRGAANSLSMLGPRVHHVPHGVATRPQCSRPGAGGPVHLMAVARLVPKKGIPVLLDAVELLDRDRRDWRLTIIGDGPLRSAVERRVSASAVRQKIHLLGALPFDQVGAQMATADVLIAPSIPVTGRPEGVPNVILEAFEAGVPVIGSDLGGIGEVVRHERTGLLVPPGDVPALAEALRRAWETPELLQACARTARRWTRRYLDEREWIDVLAALHESLWRAPGPASAAARCRR